MTNLRYLILIGLIWLTFPDIAFSQRHFPRGTHDVFIAQTDSMRTHLLQNIAPIIERSIDSGYYPGAVVLIAHNRQIVYRGVFGNRRIIPSIAPMNSNTIFDLASLTKVIATTPAIMQLIEQGKLDIDAPVAKYWPAFAKNKKHLITIRELLTHTSGLPEINIQQEKIRNETDLFVKISNLKASYEPGKKFLYNDINFIILGYLIQIVSGEHIDQYVNHHIFKPLGMNHTFFLPPAQLRDHIAPSEKIDHQLYWGQAHDPIAHVIGGISGHAGLFSNANDLGIYAQSLLDGGQLPRLYQDGKNSLRNFLGPLAIAKMTTQQTPNNIEEMRGLGWDIDSAYSNRGIFFPMQSFGHSGWTGTSIWIDPITKTWIIILTSRMHPTPAKNNQLIQDRRAIANIVAASIIDLKNYSQHNTGQGEIRRAYTGIVRGT